MENNDSGKQEEVSMKKKLDIYDILIRIMCVILACMLLVAFHYLRRIYIADQFIIPTHSMTPTLIPGDRVIVNKLIMGARIYDDMNFKDGVPMKSHRLKGLRKVEHNDILVFNFPVNYQKDKIEFKINFVYAKRCIGLPGDSVSIRNGFYYANTHGICGDTTQQRILSMIQDSTFNGFYAMPFDNVWTIKDFGPLYIPHKGGKVVLNAKNYKIYYLAVEFESGKEVWLNEKDGLVYHGDEVAGEYTFTKDYYFMCGDNVVNSNDSRYWGFVPEEFVVGVMSRITYSKDKVTGKFRWDRFMKSVLKK